MSEIEKAKELLRRDADPAVMTTADQMVERGQAAWTLDPQVRNVVGLVVPGTTRALLVVYLDESDWELDSDFEDNLNY